MTPPSVNTLEPFLSALVAWASAQPNVVAVLLVGSYARGAATEASDVDLVVLADGPARYIEDPSWASQFGAIERMRREEWGVVTSLRVWYEGGSEVEYGFTTPEWAAQPVDAGTRRVVTDGCRILFDPDGVLRALLDVL
jgi:predicted nucleotidyltransferase